MPLSVQGEGGEMLAYHSLYRERGRDREMLAYHSLYREREGGMGRC